ncbi:hypothetical protein [Sediminicoccus sp. KRV36]|uniref:hypothetical protein n=1 Tax=Sediminicoccus sp. KRV36 TaxID=3133721 RepID=UPI00200E6467|nr:hypothetical protein [Sediminicoccus rosea]UPY36417.1 hypothetical protein LHU95_19690 [Sediminicoccus rosea]
MKRVVLGLGLILCMAMPAAAQRSGTYDITGTNPDGTPYIGVLQLDQIGLLSFRLQWTIGPDVIEGVGMVSGLSFATAFSLGNTPSMGVYELRPNGQLVGQWTTIGAFAAGQETATPR